MKYSFFFTVWLTCFQNFSRPPWKNFSSGSNSVSNTSPGKIEKIVVGYWYWSKSLIYVQRT